MLSFFSPTTRTLRFLLRLLKAQTDDIGKSVSLSVVQSFSLLILSRSSASSTLLLDISGIFLVPLSRGFTVGSPFGGLLLVETQIYVYSGYLVLL